MRSRISHCLGALCCAWLCCVVGCRGANDPSQQDLIVPASDQGASALQDQGLELTAHAQGNRVRLSLTNHYPFPVVAGPRSFGVIQGGQVTPFRMGIDAQALPPKKLSQGESIQGFLRFNQLGDLVGARLVFQSGSEAAPPIYCVIQPDEDSQTARTLPAGGAVTAP
jgi:hypothetical protein